MNAEAINFLPKRLWITLLLLACGLILNAQSRPDSLSRQPDSLLTKTDTLAISNSTGLKSQVKYSARDSIRMNIQKKLVFLYGNAKIVYEDLTVEADTIMVNFETKEVRAGSRNDSVGNFVKRPVYTDQEGSFSADWMAYNFESRKGKVGGLVTEEGDMRVYGEKVKKDPQNNAYVSDARLTTCIDPHPHFYITSRKLKIIPGKQVVTGPAQLIVADVPTPGFLPFGFFPMRKGQKSGIIFPSYGESNDRGFFFREAGYYFAINDYIDLSLTGDFYFRGSYAFYARSNYAKRYSHNGSLGFSYAYNQFGTKGESDYRVSPDYRLNWSHNQDPKRRPNSTFGASVNLATSNFLLNNSMNPEDIVRNTLNSSVNWGKVFGQGRYNLSAALRHDQNTLTRDISFSLPSVSFGVARVTPFARRRAVGAQKWYEDLGFSYQLNARNEIATKDSLLFRQQTLDEMKNGISHSLPVSTSIKVLKYFTLSPSFNYNEYWYFKTIRKEWDDVNDTLLVHQEQGFTRAHSYNTSLSLVTRLYGTKVFRGGKVAAIRHVIVPGISGTFSPDFSKSSYGFYRDVVSDTFNNIERYSIFDRGIMGGPGRGRNAILGVSLSNNLEMKWRKKTDSGEVIRKIKIFEDLTVAGGYNFFAEKFKLNNFTLNGFTTLFERLQLRFGGALDPYSLDTAGLKEEVFEWNKNGRLGRITAANALISFSLNKDAVARRKSSFATLEEQRTIDQYRGAYVDFSVPWNLAVNYTLDYNRPDKESILRQNIMFNGDLNLTPKWKIGFSSGYDFYEKGWAFTSLDLYRDLHCWEFRFNWIPVGVRKSFLFTINVKSAALQDLKLNKRANWFDTQQ